MTAAAVGQALLRRYDIQRRFWESVGITAASMVASVALIFAAVSNCR
ncbi:hypothetical protein A2U01_0062841, partial [Trifolium medium]|nr:hypothetical protein [Trifolium medium]